MIWGKENPSTKRQICMGTKKRQKQKVWSLIIWLPHNLLSVICMPGHLCECERKTANKIKQVNMKITGKLQGLS